jgi:hypothetical protein
MWNKADYEMNHTNRGILLGVWLGSFLIFYICRWRVIKARINRCKKTALPG